MKKGEGEEGREGEGEEEEEDMEEDFLVVEKTYEDSILEVIFYFSVF